MTIRGPMIVAACVLAVACGRKSPRDADASDAAPGDSASKTHAAVSVRTAAATTQPFSRTVDAVGTVVARPGGAATMSSPGAARVARILVAPGDRVHRGDALVEFERAPFEAEAARAEVARTAAQHAYERAQRLTAAGIVARKEVDAAASDLAQSEAALVTARRALELATLRSPIDGVVTKVGVSLGAFADAAQPAVEVVDPSALDLVLSLSPHDVASVRAGAPVTMLAGETGTGESLGTAVVAGVGATVDSVTRGVLVRARPARAMRPLRIGESVYGRITTAVHSAVTVPVEALVPNGEEFRVFVVDDHGVAHERDVVVGGRNESVAEIVKGLAPGERVVTYGAYGVEDSARVIPVKQ